MLDFETMYAWRIWVELSSEIFLDDDVEHSSCWETLCYELGMDGVLMLTFYQGL